MEGSQWDVAVCSAHASTQHAAHEHSFLHMTRVRSC